MGRVCNTILEIGLILLLIFTPLAFGAVEAWASSLMELMVAFLMVIWVVNRMAMERTASSRPAWSLSILAFPPLLVLTLIFFQVIPLPLSAIQAISPKTYDLYSGMVLDVRAFSWRTLSIYPHATVTEALTLMTYGCIFLLTLTLSERRECAHRIVMTIIILCFALSVFGMIQHFTWNGKIYWVRELRYGGNPFGPYVNKNHFAGYVEMVIPLTIGLLLGFLPRFSGPDKPFWRQIAVWVSGHRFNGFFLLLFLATVMVTALFLSLSRGGIMSLFLSLSFFCAVMATGRSQSRKKWTVTALLLVILVSLIWAGPEAIGKRLATLLNLVDDQQFRLQSWKDTWQIVLDFPVVGTGLGTYASVYPMFKTITEQVSINYAHNDYLQMTSEIGLVGMAIVLWGVMQFLLRIFTYWKRMRASYEKGIVIGGLTACVAILVHSAVDFNLHIPANAFLFTVIMAVILASVKRVDTAPPRLFVTPSFTAEKGGRDLTRRLINVS